MSRTTCDSKVIKDILKNLTGVDQLKKLFCSLGYKIIDEQSDLIPFRDWPTTVQNYLADSPLFVAKGGSDPTQPFKIIYIRLNSDGLPAEFERSVISQIQHNCLYGLFVFSNKAQTRWHFINVIIDVQHHNKQVLRRLSVGPDEQKFERLRTAIEVITKLDLDDIFRKQGGLDPLRVQRAHDEAFDVRAVRDGFYAEYERVFKDVEQSITGISDEKRRLFTQRLFNRLMFLAFIEKKGWLKFEGKAEYLATLFAPYRTNSASQKDFYPERIRPLFFKGLSTPKNQKSAALQKTIGDVSFLNSELFQEDDGDDNPNITIPNDAFALIFDKLFYAYNFTVTESTPLDVWVAVDPEMLGRVFEELVTKRERREKGGYYTPKEIVTFMCREAIKGYLNGYAELVDEYDASKISLSEARMLLKKLKSVKIVDPACGSGAYLLGMLHELHSLARLLDTCADQKTASDDYKRKLAIIQNNLYGVDKDAFAVNIARLRLWLSLAVEYNGDEPEPLPNLDFKIEVGDSLTAPNPQANRDMFRNELIKQADELADLEEKYMRTHDRNKRRFSEAIQKAKKSLAEVLRVPYDPENAFDWRIEFVEVFKQGGFDIVLANPPYDAKIGKNIRDHYFNHRTEGPQSNDTYGLFIARGLELLRVEGHLCYIVSDTWRTIKSHKPLRKRLFATTCVQHVLDLPRWIFKAMVKTCILTLVKRIPTDHHTLIAGDLRGIKNGDWDGLAKNLVAIAGHGVDVQTTHYARYTYPQKLIASYENHSFFVGSPRLYRFMSDSSYTRLGNIADVVHGISTGKNNKYVRVQGKKRGGCEFIEDWMKMPVDETAILTDEEKRDGVNKPWEKLHGCFVPFDKGSDSDTSKGWLPNYYAPTQYFINWAKGAIEDMKQNLGSRWINVEYFFKPGITFSVSGEYAPTFRLNSEGVFEAKGSGIFCKTLSRELLLAFLCSKLARYQFKCFIKHSVDTSGDDIKEFRFPMPKSKEADLLKKLISQIIKSQKADPHYPYYLNEQIQIDALIYQMYGLTTDDIREIELWFCRRYPTLAKSQGLLAEVQSKYKSYLAHCDNIMQKSPAHWKSHPILKLISEGEGAKLEFKETLEADAKTGEKNPGVLQSALKTVAGFLNAEGGTLLIGVSDKGEIKGLERDFKFCHKHDTDGFEQKLRSLITSRFEPAPIGKINISFETLSEGTICRIAVEKSAEIIHLDKKEVYVRDGNRTIKLEGPEFTHWMKQRIGAEVRQLRQGLEKAPSKKKSTAA